MTKKGPTAKANMPKPEDYDYTTTAAEEDFEAIHADPRDNLSGSYIDADTVSESGQSAETVSVCDQSDGDTVDSVDSNIEHIGHPMSGSQLKFPDPVILPTTAISRLAAALVIKSRENKSDEIEDEGQSMVDQSEITVRAVDVTDECSKKPQNPAHEESRPFGGISRVFHGGLQYLKTIIDSVTPESRPRGMITSAATTFGMAALLATVLLALFNLSSNLTGASPLYVWNGQVVDAHDEMIQRHNQLRPILNAKGLIGWDEKRITPADVLKYPRVFILGDQARHDSKYTFQTGVNVNFLGPDKIFVTLPKQKNGKKYLTKPIIQVHRRGEHVAIVNQEDLVDGLTYVLLESDSPEDVYEVDVKSSHISTTVYASSRKPISISGWKRPADRQSSNKPPANSHGIVHHFKVLNRDIRQLAAEWYISSRRTAAGYRQAAHQPLADAGDVLRRYQLWQNQKLLELFDRIHGATIFPLDEAKKDFSDMKKDISGAARTAKKVSESLSTKAVTSVSQMFDAAQSGVDAVMDQSSHVLLRAQRNGRGIVNRLVFALDRLHYRTTSPMASVIDPENDRTSCGENCQDKRRQDSGSDKGWFELDLSKMRWSKKKD